jgi:hypothetical protein
VDGFNSVSVHVVVVGTGFVALLTIRTAHRRVASPEHGPDATES